MYLTTKARYAVIALLELVGKDEPVSLQKISDKQNLSIDYLEQLFLKLKRNDIVISFRGSCGGYILKKPPAEINIHEIICAVLNESLDLTKCKSQKNCLKDGKKCSTHDLWASLSQNIESFLKDMNLKELHEKNCIL